MIDPARPNPWLPQRKASGAVRARLFCLPHAGGGAAPFYRWSNLLPTHIELLPIRLPGREERFREPAIEQVPLLVESVAEALRGCLDAPFALVGHSMGATIAFELARWWRRQGGPMPLCLFLAARAAPRCPPKSEPIHGLPDGEFLRRLQERFQGIPEAIASHDELMRLLLPTLRADVKLIETYQYQEEPPLECPIVALAGDEDPEVSLAEVSAWREQTVAGFTLRVFRGGHFFLHESAKHVVPVIRRQMEALLA